jgi:hypothetical protein
VIGPGVDFKVLCRYTFIAAGIVANNAVQTVGQPARIDTDFNPFRAHIIRWYNVYIMR